MFSKFKSWLYGKYLPAKMKETVLKENRQLREQIAEMECQHEVDVANAYTAGMAFAIRHGKTIIRNEVVKNGNP